MKSLNLSCWLLLAGCFSAIAFVILGNSFTTTHGYISPDSANYLRLAERLNSGHGFTFPSDGRLGSEATWFATWPVGYPVLISAFSWLSGTSVFLASKLANTALLCSAIFLMYRFLGREGLFAATVLLSAGTLHIYSMTWSEAPFLFSVVVLCLIMAAILNNDLRVKGPLLLTLPVLILLPFLFRYIGIFVVAPVLLVCIQLVFAGRNKEAFRLALAVSVAVTLCALYLLNNWLQTGFATGAQRIPAPESGLILIKQLLVASGRELALPNVAWKLGEEKEDTLIAVWLLFAAGLLIGLSKTTRSKIRVKDKAYVNSFVTFGILYLIAITLLRWRTHFDSFSLRLLDPSFSLITIGAALGLLFSFPRKTTLISGFLVVSMAFSLLTHAYHIFDRPGFDAYSKSIAEDADRYADLPDNAIVLFGEKQLGYLRPDMQIASPRFMPYYAYDETWQNFIEGLRPDVPVYVETGPRARHPHRYHETVRRYIQDLPEAELVLIRP